MAEKAKTVQTPVNARGNECVYTAEELAARSDLFGVRREVVTVALHMAGKKTASFSEAKTIIEKFKNKEV